MKRRCARGQGIVEFALFVTVLLLMLAAVMDLGQLLNDHLAVTYAARQAALIAGTAGTNAASDCDALAAIMVAAENHPGMRITRIVIYEADSNGLPVGGVGNAAMSDVYPGNPGCTNPAAPPVPQPGNWLPAARTVSTYGATSVGVEIDYVYTWQTTFIATGSLNVTDHATMPLSP